MPHITTRLPMPNNTTAMVLHLLLNKGEVSERDCHLNGFRARLSEIRKKGLPIKHRIVKFKNRFKRPSQCREHYLWKRDFSKAIKLYNQINRA